jgi:hypothetical protein
LALALVGGAIFAACTSASGTHRVGDQPGSGGSGGSGNNGGLFGSGGTVIGGSGQDGGPPLVACDPPANNCPAGQICVATPAGGGCSTSGGACTSDDQCQNDTFCCSGACRKDGVADGVCVSGDLRPPNAACTTSVAVGAFAPALQCEWRGPAPTDPQPNSQQVLVSPLVADLPNDSGAAGEIIIVTTEKGGGSDRGDTVDPKTNQPNASGGVIRILNGQTCALEETIDLMPRVRDTATPAIADLNNDGKLEIVARADGFGDNPVVAFTWDDAARKYKVMWTSPTGCPSGLDDKNWDGVSIHDLNDDGLPEIVGRNGCVYNGQTGAQIAGAPSGILLDSEPTIADVDNDGKVELVANNVYRWSGSAWTQAYPGPADFAAWHPAFYGVADFNKDGKAEIVATGTDHVGIYELSGNRLLKVDLPGGERGGPPTIGDFDADGQPEVASAGATAFRVFDLECVNGGAGCEGNGVRWSKPSQDSSSAQTGSTIFDFEGDGQAEAVYADECFVRVYNGKSGDVLFSAYRSSCTWWEQPIVADPDHSSRTKIIVNSNINCHVDCSNQATTEPGVNGGVLDKEHPGVRCKDDKDCVSNHCVEGFCRCTADAECGEVEHFGMPSGDYFTGGLICSAPLPGTPGAGNVCRMQHPNPVNTLLRWQILDGIKVYRDRLDRWASSRPLWNQHVYSITNIDDDGKVPKTSAWKQNFADPKLNNFRQNRQGTASSDLADITGAVNAADACSPVKVGGADKIRFTGKVCNRGLRGVAASMPASFYLGTDTAGTPICQTKTDGPVAIGNNCKPITCDIDPTQIPPGTTITMVVNDAGKGQRITDECNYMNNTSSVVIDKCEIAR